MGWMWHLYIRFIFSFSPYLHDSCSLIQRVFVECPLWARHLGWTKVTGSCTLAHMSFFLQRKDLEAPAGHLSAVRAWIKILVFFWLQNVFLLSILPPLSYCMWWQFCFVFQNEYKCIVFFERSYTFHNFQLIVFLLFPFNTFTLIFPHLEYM